MIRVGDIVARKSYDCDVLFRVVSISSGDQPQAQLKGVNKRLSATAELTDLVVVTLGRVQEEAKSSSDNLKRKIAALCGKKALNVEKSLRLRNLKYQYQCCYGTVVHLDGDEDYCEQSQIFYDNLGIRAACTYVPESEQQIVVSGILQSYHPDVLVLTGHDGKTKAQSDGSDGSSYHASLFFSQAVKKARKIRSYKDDLSVIAGACQSNYELLMASGANFASSPGRVLIDLYDPCIVAAQLALLPIREYLDPGVAVQATSMKHLGIGGLESQGKTRMSSRYGEG